MAAVVLGVVILGLAVASVVLDSLIHQSGIGGPAVDALITAAAVVPVTAVGTFLAARQPRNLIGWMLLAIVIVELSPTSQYLILDYRMHHGSLPVGWVAVVLEECWPMFLVLTTLLLWLFPNGTLPPGRWHRAATIGAAGWLLFGLATSSRGVLVAAGGDIRIQANGDLANPLPGAIWSVSSMRRSSPLTCRCGSPALGCTPPSQLLPRPASTSLGALTAIDGLPKSAAQRPYGRDLSDSQADSAGRFSSPTPQ